MKQYGVLGEKLGHSYSPQIHALLGDYPYGVYEKTAEELPAFLQSRTFDGMNVTIPYKKAVIPYCAALSDTAQRIGSVNTLVRRPDGLLIGYNTDYEGFLWMVERSGIDPAGKKVLVLGDGGVALTVRTVLHDLHAGQIVTISRRGENNYTNLHLHQDAQVIVNTTPVGMYPKVGESVIDLAQFPRCEGVLDLIYNPARTKLMLDAERLGIACEGGLSMLVAQARRAAELFFDTTMPNGETERVLRAMEHQMHNIVLIGMPGCGKSTAGKLVAQLCGRTFVDADEELVRAANGKSIPQIFAEEGEEGFRMRETAVLAELGKQSGLVIATGGGCVTQARNYDLLHQNSRIVWLQRDSNLLPTDGRPLSQGANLAEMYARRKPMYERFADTVISVDEDARVTAQRILDAGGTINGK